MARPKYEVLEKCFIAPHTLFPGSIITMTGEPADHLKPLNPEAEEAMERWYNKTYEFIDERTGQKVTKQPNLSKRPVVRTAAVAPTVVELHHAPARGMVGEVVGLIDTPLQPDLEITNPEAPVVQATESFDGDVEIESAAEAPKKKAS